MKLRTLSARPTVPMLEGQQRVTPDMNLKQEKLVSPLLFISSGLLLASYFLPFMRTEKLFFFTNDHTLLKSIGKMWSDGMYILAIIIFLFSVLFPVAKLATVSWVWSCKVDATTSRKALDWISWLGKWSMLDVFVLAILIVLVKAKSLADATPQPGLYVFAGAILLSMVSTELVSMQTKRDK